MAIKKLIEVALPLEAINAACVREKVIRHGHPSTLHLWWARRPLAAARAVLWSSLVDDPSSHPDLFPTEVEQNRERNRLFGILEKLVVWENSNNLDVLNEAKAEISKYTGGVLPEFLDPFAGGGAIPLEAQRLGLKAHAHDLNPVAVIINKALMDIPCRFNGKAPINPMSREVLVNKEGWKRALGLAKDVKYYGELLKSKAYSILKEVYPLIEEQGTNNIQRIIPIAWLWARTVKCPNPLCGCQSPLIRSFALSKKRGKEAYVFPETNNRSVKYTIKLGKEYPKETVNRTGARCLFCNNPIDFGYIRKEAQNNRMGAEMIAIVGEGEHGRVYVAPTNKQVEASKIMKPEGFLESSLPDKALGFRVQAYGMRKHSDLYSNRQLLFLKTLCDILPDLKSIIEKDARDSGLPNDSIGLADGGTGAKAYSEAIIIYLSFLIDKLSDYHSSICSWNSSGEKMRNTFGRQAIPMVWDYAEGNPFSSSSGSMENMLEWIYKSIMELPCTSSCSAEQFDAQENFHMKNLMISTDPPYYNNIGYADLSDYFYVWLRRNLSHIYPHLFETVLTPKQEELIATPFRHEGSNERAKLFFENGMKETCKRIFESTDDRIPVTIYYAYKQSEVNLDNQGISSSGWETMLNAVVSSGFSITGTWPMRTEMANRSVASGTNALASSIVLVCRKRPVDAPVTTRRNMINTMRREMRTALQKLQSSNIAPVDMAQSAIGPGMAVFSRYSKVLEADGTPMSVRSALAIINEELDAYFNEQVGSMDSASRFCVDLYTQLGYNQIKYGEAEVLANAKGISIPALEKRGILYAKAGVLHLYERGELPTDVDAQESNIWLLTQQLTHIMSKDGIMGCAKAIVDMVGTNIENARDLAYRLYDLAEKKKWSEEAYAYNSLVVAWPDIQSAAAEMRKSRPQQQSLF